MTEKGLFLTEMYISRARALAMSPDYMPLDEVTSALDPQLVGEVLDTMRLLCSEGTTIEHDVEDIAQCADVEARDCRANTAVR